MRPWTNLIFAVSVTLCFSFSAFAQEEVFQLEPTQSHVAFTLGDVFHTVHGTFELQPGTIRFDPVTGAASGQLVVEADSGNSGNNMRDRKMKNDVLQTQKFPDIVFAINHVAGSLPASGSSTLQVSGNFIIHGSSHPLTLSVPVNVSGGQAAADVNFDIPYVKWGLKNPSTLFLRVSQDVQIKVHAVGHLEAATAAAATMSNQ